MTLPALDLIVIAVYMLGCAGLGGWLGRGVKGLEGYFLGERAIPTWALLVSIVATETSTATFLSVPALAFRPGGNCTYLQLALGLVAGRFVVAAILMPAYFRGRLFTAYQVLDQRFGPSVRGLGSVLFLISRTLGGGLRLWLAALALSEITAWSAPAAIVVAGTVTVLYTYLGGMRAVVWTDVLQFAVYVLGALVALAWIVHRLPGGWTELVSVGSEAGKFHWLDLKWDVSKPFTFWSGFLGGMVLNTATHGADQLMVQRYLSARSQRSATTALLLSGLIVFAQFALFLLIGVGLFVLYRGTTAANVTPDRAFVRFIVTDLPRGIGLVGLLVAAIFSSTMSSLSSSLNAAASSTVNDLLRPIWPDRDERHWLGVARWLTVGWGLVEMAVALGAMGLKMTVVEAALAIASFVTGIVLGLFLLGQMTRRVKSRAALIGAVAGLATVGYLALGPALGNQIYPWATVVAWPWYALVGSGTVVGMGVLVSFASRHTPPSLEGARPEGAA